MSLYFIVFFNDSFNYIVNITLILHFFTESTCITNGGPNAGKPCIFPFIWKSVTYNGCPPDPEVNSETWCSTKVDENGNHIIGQSEYGFCSRNCPKHTGKSGG